ncbi:MAG: hypothetical protein ACT4OZ_05975 [Gemmatimonadota bacterium]
MWSLIQTLLARLALLRVIWAALKSLGWLIPVAFLLKLVGLPLLILLAILAIPLFIVLALVGLPALLVVGLGGALLALVTFLLSLGFAVLKLALPIILLFYVVKWLTRERSRPGDPPPP